MNIYFAGIGGVGIGPLAELAQDAGYSVVGSDTSASLMTKELEERGITVVLNQNGDFLRRTHDQTPIDWFVYTAALPGDHPELVLARTLGIKTSKRDEFTNKIAADKGLKILAVSGTHGKTTTTAMFVWTLQQLGIPFAHLVGTGLSFAPSGRYQDGATYLVYEADEFDRNMLRFHPDISVIPSLDFDHPDVYPTVDDYRQAFRDFIAQSRVTVTWQSILNTLGMQSNEHIVAADDSHDLSNIKIAGSHNRRNAFLVSMVMGNLGQEINDDTMRQIIEQFPGSQRRFEKLANNLYTDYGHHPVEIAATLQLARELNDDVVLIYEPHQNARQYEIRDEYTDDVFRDASEIYWVPTYLTRGDSSRTILTPQDLTTAITDKQRLHFAELDDTLWQNIQQARDRSALVLVMGAGTIDNWVRSKLTN